MLTINKTVKASIILVFTKIVETELIRLEYQEEFIA